MLFKQTYLIFFKSDIVLKKENSMKIYSVRSLVSKSYQYFILLVLIRSKPFSLLVIIECKSQIEPSNEQRAPCAQLSTFLAPIHIRQNDETSSEDVTLGSNQWKLIDSNDDVSSNHFQNFYRICPTANKEETDSPKLEV